MKQNLYRIFWLNGDSCEKRAFSANDAAILAVADKIQAGKSTIITGISVWLNTGWGEIHAGGEVQLILDKSQASENVGCDSCGISDRQNGSRFCRHCGPARKFRNCSESGCHSFACEGNDVCLKHGAY